MAVSLRPTIDLLLEDEQIARLSTEVRQALEASASTVRAEVSATLRPALIAAMLEDDLGLEDRPALIVTPDDRSAREMSAALGAFLGDRLVRSYPSRGTGYASQVSPPPHLTGLRIDALDSFGRSEDRPPVVVASAIALAESVPDASLRPAGFRLAVGEEHEPSQIASDLVAAGYERVDQVQERGQFAVRGGILDVFSATEERATRIDFFGDEIESMRWFSTFTQRSLGQAESIELAPAAELDVDHREMAELAIAEARENESDIDLAEALPLDHFRAPLDLIPEGTAVILTADEEIEPALKDHWEDVTTAMHADDARHLYEDVAGPLGDRAALILTRPGEGEMALRAMSAETPARNLKEAEAELRKLVDAGYRTVVAFDSRGEAERARYGFDRLDTKIVDRGTIPADPGVSLVEARLSEGFVSPRTRIAVLPFRRLLNRRRRADERAPEAVRGRLTFSELRVGDHVVHEDHGVARFAGFETREVGGITRDYLYLEYKGEDRVYVPTDQFAKLSRYSGGAGSPTLSALGGKTAVLCAASPGALGGLRGLVHLRAILGNLGITVLPDQIAVPKAHEAFAEDGSLTDPKLDARIRGLGRSLATHLGKFLS